ncbi:MAG: hypothetical protein ACI4PV_07835 [Butyricicoccus sp.]
MNRKKLECGCGPQVVCSDCYRQYSTFSAVGRARLALKSGRAEREDELREYLARVDQAEQEQKAQQRAARDSRVSGKTCLRCGGRMLTYGPLTFKLGEETFFLSDWNRLMSGSLTMEVLRCEECGKAEFFIPEEQTLHEAANHSENKL